MNRSFGTVACVLLAAVVLSACQQKASSLVVMPQVPALVFESRADYQGSSVPGDLRRLVDWVARTGDHGDRSFAVIDKRGAHIYVFDGSARLLGSEWILLGQAKGDYSEAGIGTKAIADITPAERTTPAGRFVAVPGFNAETKPVVWVDYDAAVSMHVVITDTPSEHRLERLASPDPNRHRISWGCINLPSAFFYNVVQPAFETKGGIVYVLPETEALTDFFPRLREPELFTSAGPRAGNGNTQHGSSNHRPGTSS